MTHQDPIAVGESGWALAWRMARREIRGSVARFRVFLGALMLGVAAIGTVGSVAEAMRDGIAGNARLLLGGDVELRSLYIPTPEPVIAAANPHGKLSQTMTMRAMLQTGDERRLVSEKAMSDYQREFREISMQLMDRLDTSDWTSIFQRLVHWKLELEQSEDAGMSDVLDMQFKEANRRFAKF